MMFNYEKIENIYTVHCAMGAERLSQQNIVYIIAARPPDKTNNMCHEMVKCHDGFK